MPGFITHYICGQAALKAASPDIQQIIKPYEQFYNIGTQGPDIFFYYIPGLVLKPTLRDIGIHMHHHSFGDFMANMLDVLFMEEITAETKNLLFAYISGFLTHYALDAIAHPYVYSQTGIRKTTDKPSVKIKYSVEHRKFETAIDSLLLNSLTGEKPQKCKLWQLIKVERNPATIIAQAMSSAVSESYNRNIIPQDVYNAMRYMMNFTRIMQFFNGRKKRFKQLIENLTISENLFFGTAATAIDYMNLAHIPWSIPGTETKNDSFVELYNDALQQSIELTTALWRCVNGEISRQVLAAIIGDRSLSTGITADTSPVVI
ncbi:MAG: zinc dependent phospholipase C family protein [Defluviitaleaceae bacterium]|nr:zinc dependent phospholipase C family protein [Defluviitaleaceae bacterium]